MQKINKSTFGEKLYIDFNEDISSNTALTMKLQPRSGEVIEVTPTLETTDLYVEDQLHEANQYVSYTTTSGMFDNYAPGQYRAKATATLPSKTISTDYELTRFRVTE